jgi:hypothetical protein
MRAQKTVVVATVALSAGLAAAQTGSKLDAKAADRFHVRWSRVTYNKVVETHNPEVVQTRGQASETLSLACEIVVRDPNLVLGTCREGVATQVTGRRGRDLEISPMPSRPGLNYETLQYRQQYTQPPAVPRWQAVLRSVLRLQQTTNTSFRPQLVTELQPSYLEVRLPLRLLGQAGGELGRVKGCFHALLAESIEHVDVPFEPNDAWVRLTPDLEVQVREASCTGSSFRFRIDARPRDQFSGRPLTLGDPLPGRLVVGRQFLGEDGRPTHHFRNVSHWLPAHVAESGGGGGGSSRITAIRFLIAVNPTHCSVPFELQRIPLPDPNQPSSTAK